MGLDALMERLDTVYLAAAAVAALLPAARWRALAAAGLAPLVLAAASARILDGRATGLTAGVNEALAGAGLLIVALAIIRQFLPRRDEPVDHSAHFVSTSPPWTVPDPFLLLGLTVALAGPGLLIVGLGAALALVGAVRASIRVGRKAWIVVALAGAVLLGVAWWLMEAVLGRAGTSVAGLAEGPWSPSTESAIVLLLSGAALLLSGLWPLHRAPWRLGLCLLGVVLLVRILHPTFAPGLEAWQPVTIPLALVMLAAAAGRQRWAELSVAAGLFALLAGPGPARWPGALLVAGGWLADEGQALVVRATAWTRGVLARIGWIAAALLALPAVEGALRAEVVYTVVALGALFATALRLAFRPAGVRAEPTALYSPPQT